MLEVTTTSYYVGLGSANTVKIEENGKTHYFMIDFGSAGHDKDVTPAANQAFDRIKAINGGVFDALFITHTDKDHINGIVELIDGGYLKKANKVYMGGAEKSINSVSDIQNLKNQKQLVPRLIHGLINKGVCKKKDIRFVADHDYKNPFLRFEEKGVGSVSIKLLASRSCSSVSKSHYVNSNSSVIIVEYTTAAGSASICFAGDATYNTFVAINQAISGAKDKRYQPLTATASQNVLIIPHHGALKTACAGEKVKTTISLNNQLHQARTFAGYIKVRCLYVSAYYSVFNCHPSEEILNIFGANAVAPTAAHKVLMFSYEKDAAGNPLAKLPRALVSTDITKPVYTSHAIDNVFRINRAAIGKKVNYNDGIKDISTYTQKYGEFRCRMANTLPNLITYEYNNL